MTTPLFRATAPSSSFGSKEMRETWEAQWCPNDPAAAREHVDNWRRHAAQVQFAQSSNSSDWVPSLDSFGQVIDKAAGSAGFDGWEAKEIQIRKRVFPEIIMELYEVR
eukprot:6584129-Pyramimonas_sp.AAC.1